MSGQVRVLYSFPHKIGADRICHTAWHQVEGLHEAGADVLVETGAVARPLPEGVAVATTLARGRARLPYRAVGRLRALALHDAIVARRLPRLADRIDVVHAWPLGALQTLFAARELGIPTVLERPNAHTRFAFEVVRAECERLGIRLPPGHEHSFHSLNEHAYNERVLEREEAEYAAADRILCPSAFVERTFLERGFHREQLLRHMYGVDLDTFFPPSQQRPADRPLTALYVGVAAVRKGLHFALDAWLRSSASRSGGTFLVAGEILPDYGRVLAGRLAHPSVHVLGHRGDVPDLMRTSDVLVLPSIEEGSSLVCTEAMACGCVPLVSTACTSLCVDEANALVHDVADVAALADHLSRVDDDRVLLDALRARGLVDVRGMTWTAAGESLVRAYDAAIAGYRSSSPLVAA